MTCATSGYSRERVEKPRTMSSYIGWLISFSVLRILSNLVIYGELERKLCPAY